MFLGKVTPLWLLAEAVDPAMQEGGVVGMLMTFVPLLAMGVFFYFRLIRPQKKKDKQVKQMLAELKVGDRVTTIGGIHGTVVQIKDDTLIVAVGQDKVKLVFARWAIRSVDEISIANDAETLV